MEAITLNGEPYTQEVKLSSPAEILKYTRKNEKAVLTLKMKEHLPEEIKTIKDRKEDTQFCEFRMVGEDPTVVITGEAWGSNVKKIKEILPVNAVFKIKFKTKKPFKSAFMARKVPYIIGFSVKKTHFYYPHEESSVIAADHFLSDSDSD